VGRVTLEILKVRIAMIYGWSLSRNVRPGEQIDHPTEGIAFIPPVLHQLSRVFEVKFLHMYMIFYSMLEPLNTYW
jgi:hypothetical protein